MSAKGFHNVAGPWLGLQKALRGNMHDFYNERKSGPVKVRQLTAEELERYKQKGLR